MEIKQKVPSIKTVKKKTKFDIGDIVSYDTEDDGVVYVGKINAIKITRDQPVLYLITCCNYYIVEGSLELVKKQ